MLPVHNLFFVASLAVLTSYLTFLTTKGGLTDNRHPKMQLWKRLTQRGKIVFLVLAGIAATLILQEYNNELISNNKDNFLKKENNKRDAAIAGRIKAGVDYNSKKLFNSISEAFKKQGLSLDTVKNKIKKIQDSTKKTNTIINASNPFFSLCKDQPITLTSESPFQYVFDLNLCNSSAPSRNMKAKVYVVSIDSTSKMYYSKTFDLFQLNAQMDEDSRLTQQIIVPAFIKFEVCYFLVKGSWTNGDSSKTFKIDFIYHYNIKTKNSGGVTAIHDVKIRNFLDGLNL